MGRSVIFATKTNKMESIKLTSKDNTDDYINLKKVASFTVNGRGTRILYVNGQTLDVKESWRTVEHLIEHCVVDVSLDDV